MEFKEKKREGLIVYLYHLRNSRQLRKFGTIHYVSRKMKYVVLYINTENEAEIVKRLQSLHFFKKVDVSLRPQLKTKFADELGVRYKLTDEDREKYKTGRKAV